MCAEYSIRYHGKYVHISLTNTSFKKLGSVPLMDFKANSLSKSRYEAQFMRIQIQI